ncbi:MAG: polyhydroxyalkanoate biosynthesis repressor PhaR [Micavibrio aeruginosavorus]|uniref:Polyhydroxyalkanoate biosynthesis repressor PhaR n=1 Tax=Micavibrio aeruginosavorus TaxID=349221 RepID=A0A2W5FMF7_9BACT|nr:MAG: polyhydroxyalkanoate biosynthesis repressor PhaR [Micavibrio aeruginosavorus]
MAAEFSIGNRLVGENHPPLVIAEIGINHEGNLEVAKQMVDAAKRAGAEVIKHQTHIIEDEMSGAAKKVIPGNADVSIYEIMARCALNGDDERALQQYVISKGMEFISTPFSRAASERLKSMDIPAYKIGSGECNNFPLIEHIAEFGKPVIMSTGMNDLKTVAKSVQILRDYKIPFALLHCTNIYPTPYNLVRLNGMVQLKEAFPDAVVGLSDHCLSNYPCLGAVALGASVLERHFTDHMDRTGPDIEVSMDENSCRDLIVGSKAIWEARGGDKNVLLPEEQITRDFAYATVVTIKPIKKGEAFTKENIWVKRPGTGKISAEEYKSLLGMKAKQDIAHDSHVSWDQVEDRKSGAA